MMPKNLKYESPKRNYYKINYPNNQAILKDLNTKNNPPIRINIPAP